ncbi:T9SS type A sorting domain-containing protein [Flavivirga eckloniae]|nr:T9SS type A sorting domain-containing protein [Flavivirga eckloniae]
MKTIRQKLSKPLIIILLFLGMQYSIQAQITVSGSASETSITSNTASTVAPSLTVSASENITDFTVSIIDSYSTNDQLSYTGSLPSGITVTPWNATTRSIVFNGTTTPAEWQTFLRTVTITTGDVCSPETRQISFAAGETYYNPLNGHFYRLTDTQSSWTNSQNTASSTSYYGREGYLVTLTSEAENTFVSRLVGQNSWMGASDDFTQINNALGNTVYANQSAAEGNFYWVTGPEKGTQLTTGNGNGTGVPGVYQNWRNNEPNNSGIEHFGHVYTGSGDWNDFADTQSIFGIIEFGSMPNDVTVSAPQFSKNITIQAAPSGSISGGGVTVCTGTNSTNLTLTGLTGTVVRWESSIDNFITTGTPIANTTTSLNVTNITETTYYRAVVNSTAPSVCNSLVTSSTPIFISELNPGNVLAQNTTICAGADVELYVTGQDGTVQKWQRSTDNTNWTDIANTTTTLTETIASAGTVYYRVVLEILSCGTSQASASKEITIVNGTSPVGGQVSSATHASATNSGTLTLTGQTGTVVKWQQSTDDGIIWSDISNTATTYNYTNIATETLFRAQLTNGSCGTTFSDEGTVTLSSFTVSTTALTIAENAGTDTFTVVLGGEPASNVVLDISSSDTDEATVSLAQLTFTNADWDAPQTVTVTGVNDVVTTNDVATITIAVNDASSNDAFDSLADKTIAVTLTNDDAEFTITDIVNTTVAENAAYTSVSPAITGDTPFGALTYTLGGTDAGDFTIDSGTGVVSMIARDFENPVDDNTDNVYVLTITATDTNGNSDTEDWTVEVTDVVEAASFTIDAIANTTVAENAAYTSVTPNITGTPIGTVSYALSGTDAGDFTIDSGTGVVSMIAQNFENPADDNTNNVYELIITVTDSDGNADSEDWTVEVTDVVEVASFTIDAIANTTVAENAAYTSVTPNITGTPIGTVSYALSGTDAGDFTIDSGTGVVSMVAQNFENPADDNTNNVYELIITVTDSDGNADSEDWTVEVTDVVEAASFTIDAIANTTVAENAAYTSVTPNITGTPIGTVSYALSGTDAGDFTIDSGTGVVSMVAQNFENPADDNTNNVYELIITVTDSDGNSDSEDWTVEVTDVVEAASFTIDAIANTTVAENAAYTSVTPNITGTPIGTVSYALSGTDAGDFTIDSGTGVVSMVAQNFENPADDNTNNVYELIITVTDSDGNADSEDWTVEVTDVVEVASFTIDAIANTTVAENAAYTSVTPNITGTPIGTVSYALSGTDAGDFTIDSGTGVVSMVAQNFENPADDNTNNVYELIITITDSDGNADSEDWTVEVTDDNGAEVLAQIGLEGDNPDSINAIVTVSELNTITGLTDAVPANETAYQDYIDANPDSFSSPAILSEVQAMVDAVNTLLGNEDFDSFSFNMYPNPASSMVNLTFNKGENGFTDIEIYNTIGQSVFIARREIKNNKISLDISSLPSGTYFLNIKNQERLTSKKLVIN